MAEDQTETRRVRRKTTKPSKDLIAGRVPPNSPEMERAVLCAALIDPNGMTKVVDVLTERSFYDRRHQVIFAAMLRLFQQAAPIDILTVSEDLRQRNELEVVGGDAYLAQLSGEVATSAHAEHYARIVQDRYALRELIHQSTKFAEEAFEVPDAAELLDRAMGMLYDIYYRRRSGGFEPLRQVVNQTWEFLDSQHRKRDQKLTGVGTGFERLDELTSGFQNGELIVIAGRPSMGKTAFSLDLARNACWLHQVPVAYFSLEMAAMAICLRMLAAEARIEHHRIRTPYRLNESEWPLVAQTAGRLAEMPFFIDDTGNLGLNELRARARRLKQQHNIGIIFIDYLQLMQPPKADNREQEVAQISRSLKGLARELNIPVVTMSQLSRAVEHRGGDKIPQLADLRDSGAIEQDADVVMFIHRKKQYKSGLEEEDDGEAVDNTAHIIIRKQRNGPTGAVELIFNDVYTRFEEKESADYVPVHYAKSGAAEEPAPF
ncbi:MAG: replicative DNA helicase [Calditrichaeota bacterium]|nr:replicative DNA helicase [Calditrichota bacterium]